MSLQALSMGTDLGDDPDRGGQTQSNKSDLEKRAPGSKLLEEIIDRDRWYQIKEAAKALNKLQKLKKIYDQWYYIKTV